MKRLLLAVGLAVLAIGGGLRTASAQFAVIDVNAAIQWIQQLSSWTEQLQRMRQQYDELVGMRKTLKDPRSWIGLLANSTFERQFVRRYMPADFDAAMNMRYGGFGGIGTDPFGLALQKIVGDSKLPEVWAAFEHVRDIPDDVRWSYDTRLRGAQAAMAGSQVVHGYIDTRLSSIEGLIDSASGSSDLKESVDINTRVNAEVALLLAEALRLNSQQSFMTSAEMQQRLTAQSRSARLARWESSSW